MSKDTNNWLFYSCTWKSTESIELLDKARKEVIQKFIGDLHALGICIYDSTEIISEYISKPLVELSLPKYGTLSNRTSSTVIQFCQCVENAQQGRV